MNELILSSISPISFPCLKELFLSIYFIIIDGNNLTSIELITQAHLPNLENLNLSMTFLHIQNKIISCRLAHSEDARFPT